MKIDKKAIDMLLKLNDDQLWNTLMVVSSKSGVDMRKTERPENMSKIRDTLASLTESDIARAAELFSKRKSNG